MDNILASFQLKMLQLYSKHNIYKKNRGKIDSSKTIVEFPDRIFHSQQHIEVDKFHVQPQNNSLVVLPSSIVFATDAAALCVYLRREIDNLSLALWRMLLFFHLHILLYFLWELDFDSNSTCSHSV